MVRFRRGKEWAWKGIKMGREAEGERVGLGRRQMEKEKKAKQDNKQKEEILQGKI